MYKIILFATALLILEAILVWKPFNSEPIAYQNGWNARKTAGQITKDFSLTQEVPAKLLKVPTPKRRITHWWKAHDKLYTNRPNCFGIRFADYERKNSGHLEVAYSQGDKHQKWLVQASHLHNAFHRFCPSVGLTSDEALRITINGVDGKDGHSATVWLSESRLDPAIVNGARIGGRSLNLRLTYFRHMGPDEIFLIDGGAFAAACACSFAIAMLALVSVRKKFPAPEDE